MNSDQQEPADNSDIDSDTLERDDAIIGVALRWSLLFVVLAILIAGITYVAWPTAPPKSVHLTELAAVEVRQSPPVKLPQVRFTDITSQAGIDFRHENAAHGRKLLPETMGGGCAFFDFDADGDQDLLLVNGLRHWPWDRPKTAGPEATTALYENDGAGNFTDVSSGSGVDVPFYGQGVAAGDYDNDGLVDVFISALGPNRLFHNAGNGIFRDVTQMAGIAGEQDAWGSSCGWLDFDRDGDLDLFVSNYLQWSREYDEAQNFQLTGGGRAYGRPQNFEGTFPYLYRNEGNGQFTEVAQQAGLHVRNPATNVPMAKSLGLAFADFDGDDWIDIVVANDTVQNFLFHNQQDGTFQEIGAPAGVAFDMNGNARGAMGIDIGHFRESDAIGIAIGNFSNEMTALYVSYGKQMQFMDEAISTGLGPNTRLQLTFGVFYADFDLDGRLDLFAANGHLEEEINRVQPSQHYEQPPQLFWNCGSQHVTEFLPVDQEHCGPDLFKPLVGRGASYADIDGDGDLDFLVMTTGGRPRLLRNDQQLGHNWLRFKLTGSSSNRDAIGALVEVELDDRLLVRQVIPTRSYISQVELPVTFGLGNADRLPKITVHWPDGLKQQVQFDGMNRTYHVQQNTDSRDTAALRSAFRGAE